MFKSPVKFFCGSIESPTILVVISDSHERFRRFYFHLPRGSVDARSSRLSHRLSPLVKSRVRRCRRAAQEAFWYLSDRVFKFRVHGV